MRENYRGNKKRKEEARKKKQEDKRNKRLQKQDGPQASEVGNVPLSDLPAAQ